MNALFHIVFQTQQRIHAISIQSFNYSSSASFFLFFFKKKISSFPAIFFS